MNTNRSKTMGELSRTDTHYVLSRIPRDVVDLLRKDARLCIGGGIIRATISQETPNDIDIFGANADALVATAEALAERRRSAGETVRVFKTANAVTVITAGRLPVQFITRWTFAEPQQVVASFDFTVCQAVIFFDPAQGEFRSATSDQFYPDLAAKRLVYTSPERNEDAGGSILRVIKYVRRGYSIQVSSLGAVCSRLFTGMKGGALARDEVGRAKVLTGLLREVDPLLAIDGIEVNEDDHHNPERMQ